MTAPPTFGVDSDALHEIVSDHEHGLIALRSLGGVRGLAAKLHTHPSRGLDVNEGEDLRTARIATFSTNVLPEAQEVTFLDMVKECLEDRMLQVLIGSACISLVLGLTVPDEATGLVNYTHGWLEGAAILLSVMLVTLVSSLNNYEKEQKFKELTRVAPPVMVSVVRGGRTVQITDHDLVVGDVLNIAGGDVLTVDGVLLHSSALKVDESSATGENDELTKTVHGDCVLRSGSNVVEGEGTMLVTGVGIHSFAGRIAMQVRARSEETPLQEKLSGLADTIGHFGMAAAFLMFSLLSLKELYDSFVRRAHPFAYKKYLDNLTTAVTIVVVAVPEGLPLSVTIALAYSMKQMFRENNLVRHLAACETMGGATTICTDKTGTITQNEMSVTDGLTSTGEDFAVPVVVERTVAASSPLTAKSSPLMHTTSTLYTEVLRDTPQNAQLRRLLLEGIAINTKCHRTSSDGGSGPSHTTSAVRMTGNRTEQALVNFAERLGVDAIALRETVLSDLRHVRTQSETSPSSSSPMTPPPSTIFPSEGNYSRREMNVYPFSSARKRMTTAIALRDEEVIRYHVKGASELVLECCQHVITPDGVRVSLNPEMRDSLLHGIMRLSRRRLRTLALAYTETPLPASEDVVSFPESDDHLRDLTLLLIVGIRDPVRPEVPDAIEQCRSAGVTVRMITGDNKATAVSIAKEVGIYGPVWFGPMRGEQGLAMEGHTFREIARDPRRLTDILPRLQVISRASPLDKQILVSALMQRGEVVAVTGDGTNDAPALKNASVGFSMNGGTEVAKNASDVVILDDNFSTIVTAMRWGRNVRDNISKFLQFQMTVNVAAVVVSFIGSLLDGDGESPLKPVQLLWLNLIMDTLAALALATETPSEDCLKHPPKPKAAPLITNRMWVNIIGQSLYQVGLQLWLLRDGFRYFEVPYYSEEHLTVVFNIFVLLQLVNEFNARILDRSFFVFKGIERAPLFLLVVGTTFVIQVLGVQYGGAIMQTTSLSSEAWRKCFMMSIAPLPIGALLRCVDVPEPAIPEEAIAAAQAVEDGEPARRSCRWPSLKAAARSVVLQQRVIRALQEETRKRK